MRRIENPEWLSEKLSDLARDAKSVIDGLDDTEYNSYTALKLIAVRYYAGAFLKVALNDRQKRWYDGAVYVDLFAGTGLVNLKDSGDSDFLPGSPMCIAMLETTFDYIICVEIDGGNCGVLRGRLGKKLPSSKFSVINGDCNSKVSDVIREIRERYKNPIVLVFADPEGMELKFSTLKALSTEFKSCDFIVNVNAQGVRRTAGKYSRGISNVRGSIQDFMSKDVETVIREMEEGISPQSQYAGLMADALGRKVGETVRIKDSGDRIAYYLLGHTRKTRGGSGYMNAFKVLPQRIGWADKDTVRKMLDVIKGRQPRMDDYWKQP